MEIDTSILWKPFLFFFAWKSIFLFLSILNPVFTIVVVLYAIPMWRIRIDGKLFDLIFLGYIFDITLNIVFATSSTAVGQFFIFAPFVFLIPISILLSIYSKKEYILFKRTIISFNDQDRIKAKTAIKTKDATDIAEVAKYRDWDTID